MVRWLRWTALGLLVLLLVAALWGVSRVRGASASERAALELFEQMSAPSGSNAWPLAWLLQWDVPASDLEAVVAEDAARFRALGREPALARFDSVAASRYPDLRPTLADAPTSCSLGDSGCLAHVRADPEGHAARLAVASELVERVQALASHDHMSSLLSPALGPQMRGLGWLSLPATRHALWFVQGEHDRALAGSCRAIAGYRRLATHSDTLLFSMLGLEVIGGQSALLAEMLAELPIGHALPADCDLALAPLEPGELGLCRAMRGEWAWSGEARRGMNDAMPPGGWLMYDAGATDALMAAHMAWPCGDAAAARRAQGLPALIPDPPALGLGRVGCWANLVGCALADIAAPAYAQYEERAMDAAAKLRLLQTLAWMRGQAGDGTTADVLGLLARSPHLPAGGQRRVEVTPDGAGLRMALLRSRSSAADGQAHWTIPLPPELHVAAAGR